MPFFKPEDYVMVREALLAAGRGDLIGNGCDCLNPSQPPKSALRARMDRANEPVGELKNVHRIPNPESGIGYRRGRKSAKRRQGKTKGRE